MDEELEELLEKRKEIDRRIRELRTKEIKEGRVKYHIVHYATGKHDEYCVSIDVGRYNKAIICESKENLCEEIPKLINDLEKLANRLRAI